VPGQTLQPTALVHEAYVRLVDAEQAQRWDGRGHFFAAAAEAMRRILVEHARARRAEKRGGEAHRVPLDDTPAAPPPDFDVLALDEALVRLAAVDPQASAVVQLRFFAGLTIAEAAQAVGVSARSADRLWAFARAWLYREIGA
jgi:RNA polymerase sigma factor (TIGR02999 family)